MTDTPTESVPAPFSTEPPLPDAPVMFDVVLAPLDVPHADPVEPPAVVEPAAEPIPDLTIDRELFVALSAGTLTVREPVASFLARYPGRLSTIERDGTVSVLDSIDPSNIVTLFRFPRSP